MKMKLELEVSEIYMKMVEEMEDEDVNIREELGKTVENLIHQSYQKVKRSERK